MNSKTPNKTNIYHNLAIEEYLFHSSPINTPVILLWQSESAVVIGKHQNPWKECLVDELKKNSIPIARRISGGGTVFHDMGNLNYSIIMNQDQYDSKNIYDIIFKALEKFGLKKEIENKSNLCIDGKKFSGNAFAFRKRRALHHGTFLVNSDLEKIKHYLKPQYEKIQTKAISSSPVPIVNLSEINSKITIKTLSKTLKETFSRLLSVNINETTETNPEIKKIQKHFQSDEWVFGKTPDFTMEIDGKKHLIKKGKLPQKKQH